MGVVVWPVVLDMAGWRLRQNQALGATGNEAQRLDRFWFWLTFVAGAVATAAIVSTRADLLGLDPSHRLQGILSGVALIWFLDFLRNLTAVLIASLDGFPLYSASGRIPGR